MEEAQGSSQHVSPVKQAIVELRKMRAKLHDIEFRRHEPIAVIGAGLRLPGGINDLESYWRGLLAGMDAVGEVPPDRWDIEAFYDPDPDAPGKMYCRHGAFLEAIDGFDAEFFGISPREAVVMDPQQRLLLEVGWEALEKAGQAPLGLVGSSTGVFLGISCSDYSRMVFENIKNIDVYAGTGTAFSVTAARLAYFLGLKGPCMAIDTACSSSLVALHLAVGSLRRGESNMALAGGVNLIVSPHLTLNFCQTRMLAFNGRCRSFDAAADGYVRGEGCAVLVLKRLSDAKADGDNILGLIRGSAVNQDGRSAGITAPNGPSQEAVVLEALKEANVSPHEVGYVETHGTGTPLGDPIEAQALGAVLGRGRVGDQRLTIGSVKTNIGHLEAAAGIAGVIKTLLVLQHGIIPPHLHFHRANPHIALDELGLAIPTTSLPWPRGDGRRIAGVSAFGFSGTNAHMVLEAPPEDNPGKSAWERPRHLLTISARNEAALMALCGRFDNHLKDHPHEPLADTCFTANAGRSHFGHRLALVAENQADAREQISTFCACGSDGIFSGHREDKELPDEIAFLFTGLGAQYPDMGRQLYQSQPLFRKILEQCEQLLQPYLEKPLLEVMYPEVEESPQWDRTPYAEAALFALQYGLAQLWRSWGIEPSAVMGHGLGEYVAACVARVMSLEDAIGMILQAPGQAAVGIEFSEPTITFVSSHTAAAVGKEELAHPHYWSQDPSGADQLRDSVAALHEQGCRVFLEIGPHPLLLDMAQPLQPFFAEAQCSWLPSLSRDMDDWSRMLETLAHMYVKGAQIDWQGFDRDYRRHRTALPTYPFQRERYWLDRPATEQDSAEAGAAAWQQAVESARRQSLQVPIDLELHTYPAKWRALDRLTTSYIIRTLQELGVYASPGESHRVDDLLEKLHILPVYKGLFLRWLKRLDNEGLLEEDGQGFRCRNPLPDPELPMRLLESAKTLKDITFLQRYMERCGDMLVPVMTGRESALATLFPDGSAETGESLYRHWALARYFNRIIASTVKSLAENPPRGRKIRILEIGAGTGGTTSSVLSLLQPERADYSFTDVSEAFFARAEKKFEGYPFVRYSALDIEKSPQDQGYGAHGFDIIIAANVLHATRDLRQTMRNVLSLLAPNGCFILYEVTAPHSWFDITVGLIEGWQLYDDDLRTEGPLLASSQWKELLQSAGFSGVTAYPESGSPVEILQSHVLIGQAPSLAGHEDNIVSPVAAETPISAVAPSSVGGDDGPDPQTFVRLLTMATEEERHGLLLRFVRGHVAKILRRDASRDLDRRSRLMDLGVDSLMAVELRNRLGKGLGLDRALPATLIFDYPTIEAVAGYLEGEALGLGERRKEQEKTGDPRDPRRGDVAKIADLSEEEVEKMILEKLETM
jgi:acyl transferase domain-containing protein/SAM-dependent methyltransferase